MDDDPTPKPVSAPDHTDADTGLSEAEAARRLQHYGPNALVEEQVSVLARLLGYFWGPIPWMIEAAAVLSGVVRHWADFAIIAVMLLINAGVGFWQEFKAENAIAALKQRLALKARVLREGRWREVAARAAADLALTAPGLSVIITGIEEARRIFKRMTSYAQYRIAETTRVMLALLNDMPIMMITYDNATVAQRPVRGDMQVTLNIAALLGVLGVVSSFTLFWIAEHYLHLARPVTQTLIFLKLLVAGHMTIYLTRNDLDQ